MKFFENLILVDLTMTLFSEKMLISHRCIRGLMPNLIKKSWTVSNTQTATQKPRSLLLACAAWSCLYQAEPEPVGQKAVIFRAFHGNESFLSAGMISLISSCCCCCCLRLIEQRFCHSSLCQFLKNERNRNTIYHSKTVRVFKKDPKTQNVSSVQMSH